MTKLLPALLLASFSIANAAQANIEQNISNVLEKQTGKKVNVLEIKDLQSNPEFKIAIIQDPQTKYKIPVFTDKDGKIIIGLSNVFFSDNKKDAQLVGELYEKTQSYNDQQKNSAKLNALFESIPDDYVISLPSTTKGNKKITYIVSDPMCPHCQNELRNIDDRLKQTNVRMIPVGFLGKESAVKSAVILQKIKSFKTPQEKITFLKEIYSPVYKPKEEPANEMKKVENITKKISDSNLVKFVPFIYEYDK